MRLSNWIQGLIIASCCMLNAEESQETSWENELMNENVQPLEDNPVPLGPPEIAFEEAPLASLSPSEEKSIKVDLKQLYLGAPLIYSLLLILSLASFAIWMYQLLLIRYAEQMPSNFVEQLRVQLHTQKYEDASSLCTEQKDSLLFKMIGTAIPMRRHGTEFMCSVMNQEGKRQIAKFWQSVSFLNDIAVIAPLLGLLGTVMGMFYAFYDLNRSQESLSALFDGLSMSIGTTIGGIFVAVLSLTFYSLLKHKLVKCSTRVEEVAMALCTTIDSKGN